MLSIVDQSPLETLSGFPVRLPRSAFLGAGFDYNIKVLAQFLGIVRIVFENGTQQLPSDVRSIHRAVSEVVSFEPGRESNRDCFSRRHDGRWPFDHGSIRGSAGTQILKRRYQHLHDVWRASDRDSG